MHQYCTIITEKDNWKKAQSIYNPVPNLFPAVLILFTCSEDQACHPLDTCRLYGWLSNHPYLWGWTNTTYFTHTYFILQDSL